MPSEQDVAVGQKPAVRRAWRITPKPLPLSEPADEVADEATDTDTATDETADDGASEQAAEGGAPSTAAPSSVPPANGVSWTRWITAAVAVVAVLALTGFALIQWIGAGQARDAQARLEADRTLRLEVSEAAHNFAQALLTYDYQDLPSARAKLRDLATGDFQTLYDQEFGGAMEQVIIKLKAVSQATSREVYLADVSETTARAIVVVDSQVKSEQAMRVVSDSHLKLLMIKEPDGWKVQEVTVLGAAKEQETPLGDPQKTTPSPEPSKKD
ncbi:hypothetical protein [Nonomuraea soli]|uniref:Mce-associated membrane protein n=1 Tax=Nonomuraea soli TaxID=1032476 RepID=A0A7W0CF43_9ACTN|nr:hypothetical protein [Nonomuraea soli]MBA2889877.1 hypothetical protein [Nonomuraea soli]